VRPRMFALERLEFASQAYLTLFARVFSFVKVVNGCENESSREEIGGLLHSRMRAINRTGN